MNEYEDIPPYDDTWVDRPDFHAVYTVTLGELIYDGLIDFSDGTWYTQLNGLQIAWFDDEQRDRFWQKFEAHYYWREIGELPYKMWKGNLLSKIAMLAPKYKLLYQALKTGVDPLQKTNEYGKSRNIFSDFPQTMLGKNQDYASTGSDTQYERITQGDFVEKMNAVMHDYDDVDYAFVRELDTHFQFMLSCSVNGY